MAAARFASGCSAAAHHFVIHGRSKERSDAAQTRGSMPGLQTRHHGAEPCARWRDRGGDWRQHRASSSPQATLAGRGMDPRVCASASLPLRPWMTKSGSDQKHL
ncbi:MAG: hypothetical protein E5Y34_32135 [Mesorhizobium sp.]|nr:MAG: hypothetical protein E5Y34_32135 [Mesorhizobium sp.]